MMNAKKTFTLQEIHDILRDQPPAGFIEDSSVPTATIKLLARFSVAQYQVFVAIAEAYEKPGEEARRADN